MPPVYNQQPPSMGGGQPPQQQQLPSVGGTNAPPIGNPQPTTPFAQGPQPPQQGGQQQWMGPPTQSGLPEGSMGAQQGGFAGGQPQGPAMGEAFQNGAPVLPGGQQQQPQGPQWSPYQGFGYGPGGQFQGQGEFGNAMGTPGGGGFGMGGGDFGQGGQLPMGGPSPMGGFAGSQGDFGQGQPQYGGGQPMGGFAGGGQPQGMGQFAQPALGQFDRQY